MPRYNDQNTPNPKAGPWLTQWTNPVNQEYKTKTQYLLLFEFVWAIEIFFFAEEKRANAPEQETKTYRPLNWGSQTEKRIEKQKLKRKKTITLHMKTEHRSN